ncbi:MAG TPA: hypothetical protein VI320_11140 [Terracidiphilus sp.]|jgi:hypothetical protein
MGGLVLDIVVMFIFKSSVRAIRFLKSLRWNRSIATVLDSTLVDPDMGCPSVKVHYQIASHGDTQQGVDEVPFFLRGSAKSYVRNFSRNQTVVVRVNPGNPDEMLFAPSDQRRSSAAATV